MPTKIDLARVVKWIETGERVFGNPAVQALLRPLLPKLGLSEAQLAELEARHAGYQERKARAQKRAGA